MFLYIQKSNICEAFLYTKSPTLYKMQENSRPIFIYKKQDTLRHAIFHKILKMAFIYKKQDTLTFEFFMKFLKLAFLYKNHDTLRYMTFLYTKI